MDLSWGVDLWDRLDHIINHSNASSVLIDKAHKCFMECNHVWTKAAHKQKRLLDRLQSEIKDSAMDEFSLTTSLLSLINNITSICNIQSTFQDAVAKAADEYLKKTHSQIKKQSSSWSMDKRKMEDDLSRERRKYDMALKRYREKYQVLITAQDNLKKTEDNRALSRSQVDVCQNSLAMKRDDYDEMKRDYAVEITNFNNHQQTYFATSVVDWAKKGEQLYEQRLILLKTFSHELSKFTKEMVKNITYSITRFTDIEAALSFDKDAILLVQKYKTGDVPPGELQFLDLDNKQYLSKRTSTIYDNHKGSIDSSSTGSSASSFESTVGNRNQSVYSGSYSSMQIPTNTRSEPSRTNVQSVKLRNNKINGNVNANIGKKLNPEARLSIHKSSKIFQSSTPWKDSSKAEKPTIDKQKSLYQRRGRSSVRDNQPQQRSHSVSEMITNVFRSSLRLKPSEESNAKIKKKATPSEIVKINPVRQDSSDFDTDSSYEQCKSENIHAAPQIVSTPAEAVALTHRKFSVPNFCTAVDIVDGPTNETESIDEPNVEENYEYSYVGSCASYHDYDSNDPSNNYLSFKAGDQFYILRNDEGSGWLFVETVDRKFQGFVPTSYMAIQQFDRSSTDDVI